MTIKAFRPQNQCIDLDGSQATRHLLPAPQPLQRSFATTSEACNPELAAAWPAVIEGSGQQERFDALGFDPLYYDRLVRTAGPLVGRLAGQLAGLEAIPPTGPALLLFGCDPRGPLSLTLQYAVRHLHPARRAIRPLVSTEMCRSALAGHVALRYAAATIEHPANADYLLGRGWLIATYPRGRQASPSTPGPDTSAQRARWSGDILRVALRKGVPIVPLVDHRSNGILPAGAIARAKRAVSSAMRRWQILILPPLDVSGLGSEGDTMTEALSDRISALIGAGTDVALTRCYGE